MHSCSHRAAWHCTGEVFRTADYAAERNKIRLDTTTTYQHFATGLNFLGAQEMDFAAFVVGD